MPASPRTEVEATARLAMASALLWIACGEVPQGGDGALLGERLEPKALQATSGGQWSAAASLATAREDHTATLLPSGEVLATAGAGPSGPLASAEVCDPAKGVLPEWRPVITPPAEPQQPGETLRITGSRLRGARRRAAVTFRAPPRIFPWSACWRWREER